MTRDNRLQKVISTLNDYYNRLTKIDHKRRAIDDLQTEIGRLYAELDEVRDEAPVIRAVQYDKDRVQTSPMDVAPGSWWSKRIDALERQIRQRKDQQWQLRTEINILGVGMEEIQVALDCLPDLQRQVIELRHRDHKSTGAIGELMQYTDSYVRRTYREALHKLRGVVHIA